MTTSQVVVTDYLIQRMTELGVTDEQRKFCRTLINKVSEKNDGGQIITHESKHSLEYNIFDADEDGNIIIRYFNLLGQPYRWKKDGTKQSRDFIRKRWKTPKESEKYWQDTGSPQCPFFTPGIIHKFREATSANDAGNDALGTVETLFVVEGEFKAFKAYLSGIDIVGIPSIHGFYNGDVKGKLHEDIQELIIKCRVKNIVFLVDADLLCVKWAEGKDLSQRPSTFYASIKAFRESLQLLLDDDSVPLEMCYFMHLKSKFMNDAKGLDDLLCKYSARTSEIIEDLYSFQFAKKYFDGFIINDLNKDVQGRIFRYLGLTDEQEFYKTYQEFIGPREFKFKRRRYMWNAEAKEVAFVRHEDADKFMRIGPDWVKVISKLNKYGEPEEEIIPWKITEITRDYKKYPDFIDQIQRYDDFCNEPRWNGEYKRVHNGCFNLCNPLKWKPAPGSIMNSVKFLKHIFQGSGQVHLDENGFFEREENFTGDPFTVALDWLTILLKEPKQMLPVPILVSVENGTGKSTFLKWLQLIFGSNMCILGNEQFKMKFNGHYITKFIIAIDEGFLEVDKKAEKERLKQLVTADSAYLENKGMNVRKINFYGKLIICSNDADRVMKIEDGESRWFVVKVPVIPKDEMDPDLELKLKDETEAWLHFLQNRAIFHKREHRLWFKPEWFITDQYRVIVDATKSRVDRVFEDWITEQFLLYDLPVLRYPLKYLTEVFNDPKNSKYRIDSIELKTYLKERLHLEPEDTQRIEIPIAHDLPDDDRIPNRIIYRKEVARPYKFNRADWIKTASTESIAEKGNPFSPAADTPPF